jgi:serine/threonine protein kinase
MLHYFIDKASKKNLINLGPEIASGASGTVHRINEFPELLAKIYKPHVDVNKYEIKISEMINNNPNIPIINGAVFDIIQIAWPLGKLIDSNNKFVGFVMHEVKYDSTYCLDNILTKSSRRSKNLSDFYGNRLLIARNISAIIKEIHALGHYVIDLKPQNIRFYPKESYICILDTDGFSINGTTRIAANDFSDEFIAPEAENLTAKQLGLEQDLFALAVIIFRLMNGGIHPFTGMDKSGTLFPTAIQPRIFEGLYAYGLKSHPLVVPNRAGIHDHFEDSTRHLFDKAFSSRGGRPSAFEWTDHLSWLINSSKKCPKKPLEHMHFSKGCGLCDQEASLLQAKKSAATGGATRQSGAASPNFNSPIATPQNPILVNFISETWKYIVAIFLIVLFFLFSRVPVDPQTSVNSVPKAPTTVRTDTPQVNLPTIVNKSPDNPVALEKRLAEPLIPTRYASKICNTISSNTSVRSAPSFYAGILVYNVTNGTSVTVIESVYETKSGTTWLKVEFEDENFSTGYVDILHVKQQCDIPAMTKIVPPTLEIVTIWELNGSLMSLVERGQRRMLYYRFPRSGLQTEGVGEGTLYFDGQQDGDRYSGMSYLFSARCGAIGYRTIGTISEDRQWIVLEGLGPKVDGNCRIIKRVPLKASIKQQP